MTEKKLINFIEKYFIYIFIFLILWVLLGPILLTQCSFIDLTNTGGIGDIISGISAPILGLFSIVLLYLTLKMQIENNSSLKNDSNFKIIYLEIIDLEKKITEFNYNEFEGSDGFEKWAQEVAQDIINIDAELWMKRLHFVEYVRNILNNFGKIFKLRKNLKTNSEHDDFIKKELNRIFSDNLKGTTEIIKKWNFKDKEETKMRLHPFIKLRKEQEHWLSIEAELLEL